LRGLDGSVARAEAYQQGLMAFSVALARGTHNLVFEMLVHWNTRVQADLADVFLAVRPATREHLQGLHVLVDLIEAGEAERARLLVRAWHEWLTPRLVRAAELLSDAPMSVTREMRPEAVDAGGE
jgi:DNA-binding GntR family transcriptional regulator